MTRLILSFILILPLTSIAQINTEIYRKDYESLGWMFGIDGSFGYSSGNTEELTTECIVRVDHNGEKQDYFAVVDYEFKSVEKHKTKNKAFIHLRYIRDIYRWFFWEAFTQWQYDQFILLNHRFLAGTGGRFDLSTLFSPEKNKSERKLNAFIGLGAMWETENYKLDDGDTIMNLVRGTSYLSLSYRPMDQIRISVVNYFQPLIYNWTDYRNRANFELELKITQKLYFLCKLDYLYRSVPVGNTRKTDFEVKNGLRLRLP